MIRIEDIARDERKLQQQSEQDQPGKSKFQLRRAYHLGAVRLISRSRLFEHHGDEFITMLWVSFFNRHPDQNERAMLWSLLGPNGSNKRLAYNYAYDMSAYAWYPITGKRWIMDTTSAQTLTFLEWLAFSSRFLWFRLTHPCR